MRFLEQGGAVRTVTRTRWTGRQHPIDTDRYAQALPLPDHDDALMVNGCELTTTDQEGNVWDKNAFITHSAINDPQVVPIVAAGRSRWKIENENNNTLKTKGYHFEHHDGHDDGHGQQSLSSVLASLIILALLVHTVLEWMDDQYRLLRQKLPSRQRLFDDLPTLTRYLCFERWDDLITFMLRSFEPGSVIPTRLEPSGDSVHTAPLPPTFRIT